MPDVLEGGCHRSDYVAYMEYIYLQSNEKLLIVNCVLFHETLTNNNRTMFTLSKLLAVLSLTLRGFL